MVGAADAKVTMADKMVADLVDLVARVDLVVDKVDRVDQAAADRVDLEGAEAETMDLAEAEVETMALGAEGVVEAAADLLVAEWAPVVVAQAELRQQPQK